MHPFIAPCPTPWLGNAAPKGEDCQEEKGEKLLPKAKPVEDAPPMGGAKKLHPVEEGEDPRCGAGHPNEGAAPKDPNGAVNEEGGGHGPNAEGGAAPKNMEVEKAGAVESMDEVVSRSGCVIGKEKPVLLQPCPGAVHGGGGEPWAIMEDDGEDVEVVEGKAACESAMEEHTYIHIHRYIQGEEETTFLFGRVCVRV